ncbi:ketosteroid isomerase-like protein [Sphingobium sp. OAS761]|uniref:nuclear transport factor 2 family protein n=1 Tax=Sphingobium sp. OAS761 TaxID=2817901 RepID=UPI0020A18653|nr:nuclear transport factor 2 family protein [Sphingobium sp. OAS761]MCP1471827.1 ketosteroid isomerase-like protein [Sphingobium sp. OAS761]
MTAEADLAIRMRRASFNRALADADLATIERILAKDVVLITGTDSAVIVGRKAQLLAWRREFAAADRIVYVRTPRDILVSPIEPVAMEQGHWEGRARSDDRPATSGDYSAKWRLNGEEWRLEAEIFLTLA